MLGDSQIAEYLDGGMEGAERKRFEEMAAEDDKAMAELVSQQRIHHALQSLKLGEKESRQAGSDRKLKRSIMEASCGKELGGASSGSPMHLMEFEPGFVMAAIGFVFVSLVAVSLWYFAPHP